VKKILIIQTAFIGDVVLATPLIEKLKRFYPDSTIDLLLRKGNESLLFNHPHLRQVLVLDKKNGKYRNLLAMLKRIREEKYEYVINVQRFAASGFLTAFSGAKHTIGFDKNPLSFLFSEKVKHIISETDKDQHEIKRNLELIRNITDDSIVMPRLYPAEADYKKIVPQGEYVCIAPASVWFTKQLPAERWIALMDQLPTHLTIYLLGAPGDLTLCEEIKRQVKSSKVEILAGKLSFLESAALMKNARMNYVNDSAPLHFASAMNAPVSAMFLSTVPAFGFGPLSDTSYIFETTENLDCRPCGLHGYKSCPKGHFRCSNIQFNLHSA
jgi:heptosyltransferase-2